MRSGEKSGDASSKRTSVIEKSVNGWMSIYPEQKEIQRMKAQRSGLRKVKVASVERPEVRLEKRKENQRRAGIYNLHIQRICELSNQLDYLMWKFQA